MEGKSFSIREAISFGWRKSFENIWLFIKMVFAFIGVELILGLGFLPIMLLTYLTQGSILAVIPMGLTIAYAIAVFLFLLGLGHLGMPRIMLDIYERGKSEVSRMFAVFRFVLPYIGASLLLGMCVAGPAMAVAGLAALQVSALVLVPLLLVVWFAAMYVGIRLIYFNLVMIDKQLGAVDSLKYSWHITQGSVLKLIIFNVTAMAIPLGLMLLAGLNVIAMVNAFSAGSYFLVFLSGVLLSIAILLVAFSIPMVILANVHVYKKLSEETSMQYH